MKHLFEKQNKYSIRKFSIGVCSAVIGLSFLSSGAVYADGPDSSTSPLEPTNTVQSGSVVDDNQLSSAATALSDDMTAPERTSELMLSTRSAGDTWTVGEADIPEASVLEDATPTVGETTSTQRIPKKNDTRVAVTGASATNARENFPATNAIDNDLNTAWVGETVGEARPSLTIDLEKIAYIDRVNYASIQNGNTALGSEYFGEAGVITKGYIEYSTTGNDGDWHRAQITSVGTPHPYNNVLTDVVDKAGVVGSGFQRQGNKSILAISFTPVEARYLRLTPTESRSGRTLPDHSESTIFSAGSFLPFAYELIEIEERVTQTLTTDEIHYLDDNTRYTDESEEIRAAVDGSRLTVTTYEVENGVKTNRIVGQPVVTETKPQKAVWRRGTLTRPAPVATPKYTTLKATPERVVLQLNDDINSPESKAKILEKLQFPDGKTGVITEVTPANPAADTTATAGSDKTVAVTVSYGNIAEVADVSVTSIGATTQGWEGNNPRNVLNDTNNTFWVSAWNADGNTPEQPELITLKLSEEATISQIRYQSQWRVNQFGQIRKGYIEYATEENGPWTRVVIESVTGGTGIAYDGQDQTFNVADPSANANLSPVTFNISPISARYIRLGATQTNAPRQPGMVNKMVGVSTFYPINPEVIDTIEVPVTVVDERADADYTAVDAAISRRPSDLSIYTDTTANELTSAIAAVVRGKKIDEQAVVAGYATRINAAVDALIKKDADYAAVDTAIARKPADLSIYTEATANELTSAIAAVVRGKKIDEQAAVTAYATRINAAVDALIKKDADYAAVDTAIARKPADLSIYTEATANELTSAIAAVVRGKKIDEQATVTGYATRINAAVDALQLKATTTPSAYPPAETPDPNYTRPASALGAITSLTFENGRAEIVYETGERGRLDVYNDHVFRFQVDKNGNFPDTPALVHPDRPVSITVKSREDYQNQHGTGVGRLVEEDSRFIIETDKVLFIMDKATSRLSVYDRLKGEFVTKEVEPLKITANKTTQTLTQDENEYFFGGGMQNGRFTHKGNKIQIVNQNNWVDGGVASPAPFYWSSNGYGVMRHTFMPGAYDFGTDDKTKMSSDHNESRYDAFFFVNDKPEDIIKDYYELTGKPAVLPLYALYLGHLNAYNRDYWREVPEGTRGAVRQGDGKWYREFDGRNHTPEAGDVKESLNGENNNYEFSARKVIDRYIAADMPLSWFLPNDGYGAGYGQGANIDENIANLKAFIDYAKSKGVDVGLWTQSNLVSSEGAAVLHRDIDKEVGIAGMRAIKTDVAWVGPGYNFGLNGVDRGAERITTLSGAEKARPFIISLDGWAGTQRSAAIWSGDQSGGEWEYIRFHIPTYIGLGLSGNPNVGSDMDGIFGGGNAIINARDYQWKTFTSIMMNMDGWGKEPKMPFAFGDDHPTTDLNRISLKLKSTLMPYAYSTGHQANETGKPIVRAMFLDFPSEPIAYTKAVQYQYMYGDNLLVAPIYENTNMQANGDDIRNNIYLPAGSDWIDFYTGEIYKGGQVLNGFEAPIWKAPVFVKNGAIIPMAAAHNTAGELDRSNRLFTFYPHGNTSFKHYEDDGKSVEYKEGKIATTLVESKADANGRVELKLNKTEGEYNGMIKEKTTELHVNVSKDVDSVEAIVNGQRVTLTRVNTLEAYNNGTNVFFYHNDPVMETYNPRSAEIQAVNVVKNDLLKIKLAASDVTAGDTIVTINGFENKTPEVTPPAGLEKPATPTNLDAPESFITATSMKVTWEASERADSYDVEHNGVLYRNIKGTEFTFKDLEPGSEHNYKVRAVNAKGESDWSDAITKQTSNDPWLNAIEIDPANVRTNIVAQGGQGIDKLVNKQKGDQFHSAWNGTVPANPYIRVDLGGVYDLSHLEYHQRGDGGVNGRVTWARFYVSEDGEKWTETGAEDWRGDGNLKRHNLDIKGRYVHMAIEGHHGQWVSGEELLIFKKPGTRMLIPGDTNNDGRIDEDDKTSLKNYAGLRAEDSDFSYIGHVDRNKNGLIDALDISVVATQLEGGVTTPSTVAPSGNLRFEAEKLEATVAGEEIKVYLIADDLAAVNALTSTFKFNADDFEAVNNIVVPETAFTKQAENFSQVRTRGSEGDAVFNFINFGQKELLSGSGRVAYLTLRAKRPATLAFTSADGILVGNDLRRTPVDNQPVTELVNYTAAPAVPANLAVSRPTHGSVTLTWDAVPEAVRYIVEKEVNGQFVEIGRTSTPSFNVYNLEPEISYNLRVRATNPLGESANTDVVAATTVAKTVAGNITPVAHTASTPDQQGEGLERFFDGDEGTIYHSQWGKSDAVPSSLTIDLGEAKQLDHLIYVPRPAASNGTITGLTVETSQDGTSWTPTGETIRWDRNNLDKIALFPQGTAARYIRINWTSSVGGFVSGQELYIIENNEVVAPVDPTDPTSPTNPADPTDPTTPSGPVDPTDPTTPSGPVDPTDPTTPSGPVDPTEPTSPSGPVDPTDPTTPSGPADPTDPTTPSGPVDPTDPTTPSGPADPTDPTTPSGPVDPTDPTTPSGPVDPTDPTTPSGPADPTDPTTPSGPVDPTDPTTPSGPVDPTDPTTPSGPVDPTDPTTPSGPVDPTDPTTPSGPVDPTDPTTPSGPVDPTDPTTPSGPVDPTDPTTPTSPVAPTAPVTTPATPARVFEDQSTGVIVKLAAGEDANIVAVQIVHKETRDVATPAVLTGKDYDLYDIELVDKDGNIIKTKSAAVVELPVDAGKEVAEVIYLPNSDQSESLFFRQVERTEVGEVKRYVVFTAEHFSEYGIVYKPATTVPVPAPAGTSTPTVSSTDKVPVAATPTSSSAPAQPSLPSTGEEGSSLALLGGAALVAALGLVGVRKRQD